MVDLLLAMLVKERCHDFDCKKLAAPVHQSCHLSYEFNPHARLGEMVGAARFEGEVFPMRWFQDGSVRGFVGQNGRHGLSIFVEGRHIRAYWLSDTNTVEYNRIQCRL